MRSGEQLSTTVLGLAADPQHTEGSTLPACAQDAWCSFHHCRAPVPDLRAARSGKAAKEVMISLVNHMSSLSRAFFFFSLPSQHPLFCGGYLTLSLACPPNAVLISNTMPWVFGHG